MDKYLFSLQSKFLVRLLRGGDKEQILATNKSIDPLPYVRPPTNAAILLGRTDSARKQALVIPPGGFRWAPYVVEKKQLTGKPPYKVNVKFIAQMVPVNLVADIAEVGFDYNMSVKKVADEVITRSQTLWDKTIILPPKPVTISLKPTEAEIMAKPYQPFLPELVHRKVVAKVEPAKKEIPPPIIKAEAGTSDRDLLEEPVKKAPETEGEEMKKPAEEKPAGEKPAGEKSANEKPAP